MRFRLLALCVAFLTIGAAAVPPGETTNQAGTGIWSTAASLITGREGHTATLLPNGNVLVAGGTDGRGNALASAEIYSPSTNRWTPAGSMATTRLGHTATLLNSGKILVAGGLASAAPSNTLASTELYDPAANRWSSAAPMTGSRARHTATLLPDGRVLVVGGLSLGLRNGGLFVDHSADAELYDPKTNQWSTTAAMAIYRLDQTATLLSDGRVLVAGGQDLAPFAAAEIYDAVKDRWTLAAAMAIGRAGHSASRLADGLVLVVAGAGEGPTLSTIDLRSTELYDPRLNQWLPGADTVQAHAEQTATVLPNGRVLVVGATSGARPEIYDPATKRWTLNGPAMDRYQHTATLLRDGRALIVGGYGIASLSSVVVYDPNAVATTPRHPNDLCLAIVILLLALLLAAAIAWSRPGVRRRLGRPNESEGDDWISS